MSQVQENKCDPTSVARAGILLNVQWGGESVYLYKMSWLQTIIGVNFKKEAAQKLVPAFRMPYS